MSSQSGRLVSFLYGLHPLLVAAGVLFVVAVIGGKAMQGYELRQEARAEELRLEELKKENRTLIRELEYYRSDEYIERVAREELGLVRPGDVAVVVAPPDDQHPLPSLQTSTPSPTPAAAEATAPTWVRWLSIFTGGTLEGRQDPLGH